MITCNSPDEFGFGASTRLCEQTPPGEYKRKTFGTHGSFDIFDKKLTDDEEQFYKELKQLIDKREPLKRDVLELKHRFERNELYKTINYELDEILVDRAKENKYDPDNDPEFVPFDENSWHNARDCEDYFKQMKIDDSERRYNSDRIRAHPIALSSSSQLSQQDIDLSEADDRYDSDEFAPDPPKQAEQKPRNMNKNKNRIKGMKAHQ